MAECIRGIAQAAAILGDPAAAQRAATLFGAVDSLRLGHDPVAPMFREGHRRAMDLARSLLGEDAFTRACNEGRQMQIDDVVALAMGTGR